MAGAATRRARVLSEVAQRGACAMLSRPATPVPRESAPWAATAGHPRRYQPRTVLTGRVRPGRGIGRTPRRGDFARRPAVLARELRAGAACTPAQVAISFFPCRAAGGALGSALPF